VRYIDVGDQRGSQRAAGGFLGVTLAAMAAIAPLAIILGPLALKTAALGGSSAVGVAIQENGADRGPARHGHGYGGRRNSAASTISQTVWPRCRHASCARAVLALGTQTEICPIAAAFPPFAPVGTTVIIPADRAASSALTTLRDPEGCSGADPRMRHGLSKLPPRLCVPPGLSDRITDPGHPVVTHVREDRQRKDLRRALLGDRKTVRCEPPVGDLPVARYRVVDLCLDAGRRELLLNSPWFRLGSGHPAEISPGRFSRVATAAASSRLCAPSLARTFFT